MATQASKQQWFDELIGSVRSLGGAGTAHLVVDLASGRVVASSPGAADLLGGTIPDHVDDLRTSGLLSSPQFRDLRALVGTGPTGAPIDGEAPATETAQSWTDRVRLHRPDGSTIQVDLNLVVHRRPKFPAEVVMVTATPTDAEDAPAPDGEWWTLLDEEMRVVAADEAFNPHVVDPAQMIGVLAAVLVHPDDLPEILPTVMAVVRGVAATAEYTVRLVTAEGGWITAHTVLHRLGSLDGPIFIAHQRAVTLRRAVLDVDVLSRRELAIVRGLFDGLRVAQLADRDHVSTNTVRTQLKAVYRKLAVAGQAELLARFHRPA